MKRAVSFFVSFILFFSFANFVLAEDDELGKEEAYNFFLYSFNEMLEVVESHYVELMEWVGYDIDLSFPGDVVDEEGRWVVQVFLRIDAEGRHPFIPHEEKLVSSAVLGENREKVVDAADRAVRAVKGTYVQFIDKQIKLGSLKEPSKEVFKFWHIFFPRFKEMTRGEYGYNKILGWKILFPVPVEKEGKIELTVETVNYKKSKTFNANLALNETDRINESYQLVEAVIDWLHASLKEGLQKCVLKVPKGMTMCFNGNCFGEDCL